MEVGRDGLQHCQWHRPIPPKTRLRLPMLLGRLMTYGATPGWLASTATITVSSTSSQLSPKSKLKIIKSIDLFIQVNITLWTTALRRLYQSLQAPRRRGGGGDLRQRYPLVTSRSSRNSIACVTRRLSWAAPFRSYFYFFTCVCDGKHLWNYLHSKVHISFVIRKMAYVIPRYGL